jgi:hypothetical protein
MGVASQIVKYMFWSSEWSFGIDNPVFTEQWPQERMEGFLSFERFQASRE